MDCPNCPKGGQLSVAFYPIQGISSVGEQCPTCSDMVGGSNPSFPVHSSANSMSVSNRPWMELLDMYLSHFLFKQSLREFFHRIEQFFFNPFHYITSLEVK